MRAAIEISHAASRLRGTPEEIAARIKVLIEDYPSEPQSEASLRDRRLYREATTAHWLKIYAHRHWMTCEFVRRHGWKFRRDDHFTQDMLADRRRRRRAYEQGGIGWSDHDYYLRDAAGFPAAVAGHPYDADRPGRREKYRQWAAEYGLVVSFPDDFPSWWYLGRTTLVLFEPAKTLIAIAGMAREAAGR